MKIFISIIALFLFRPLEAITYKDIHENILQEQCLSCHNSEFAARQVDLSQYETVMEYVIPYDPENSLLYQVITRNDGMQMPYMSAPLSKKEIRDIKRWIQTGAHFQ